MAGKKAKQIFARIGFSDVIVPIEKQEDRIIGEDTYIVGYEDEEGEECEEDGTYLNQD